MAGGHMSVHRKARVSPQTERAPAPADAARNGNEGAPVGTGTPIARPPLPPSSGQAGAKKG